MEKAVNLEDKYPIHFYELDRLYQATGAAPEKRLALLEKNHGVVAQRDDAISREVALKVATGSYDEAIELMTGREYEIWEGGSLNVASYWREAHLLRGHAHMGAKRYREALSDYQAAIEIPGNIPSLIRGSGGRQPAADYWIGTAHAALGDQAKAKESWRAAVSFTPRMSRGGGDEMGSSARGVQVYYQALAQRKLGQESEAKKMLKGLVAAARKAIEADSSRIDLPRPSTNSSPRGPAWPRRTTLPRSATRVCANPGTRECSSRRP